MTRNSFLDVYYEDRYAGTLAVTPKGKIAFSYGAEWLESGFSLNPFSLPLRKGVFVPGRNHKDIAFGVFRDSLLFGASGEEQPETDTTAPEGFLAALAEGSPGPDSGAGRLTYCRAKRPGKRPDPEPGSDIPELVLYEEPEEVDPVTKARLAMEQDYLTVAAECGIRTEAKPGHEISAAALLERDPTDTDWDYQDYIKLTKIMTGGSLQETMEMYRRMCFNVFARNEEDHTGTQAYLYDEERDRWSLAPVFAMGYAVREGGHATSLRGKRMDPGIDDILWIGANAGLPRRLAEDIADEVRDKTAFLVERWRGQMPQKGER